MTSNVHWAGGNALKFCGNESYLRCIGGRQNDLKVKLI